MATSSARPDDLDSFAVRSRTADDELRRNATKLKTMYGEFLDGTSWGHFDADSLLAGFSSFITANGVDADWVKKVAEAFRAAGGDGSLSTLPDAAIQASLKAAGLDGTRQSVTYDEPNAYGFPLTTGYADDPVNTATGNFVTAQTDLLFTGVVALLGFSRTYNSRSDVAGAFGRGWASWADVRLRARPDGAYFDGADGQRVVFPRSGSGYGRSLAVRGLVEPTEQGLSLHWFSGERWDFDSAGLLNRVSRGPGTQVRFDYDDHGRLAGLTHTGGAAVGLEWTGDRIASLTGSDGRASSFRYDDAGNLVEADGELGRTSYRLDDAGRIVSLTDADGVMAVVNTYDDDGRVQEQVSNFGRRSFFRYLPGRVTVTGDDSGGPSNTYIHDQAGRLLAVIDGHGQRFSMTYDDWGNPVSATERNGAITVQQWDERSRLVRRVLPSGAEFGYQYDDIGRVLEVTTSTGAVTRYRYSGDERSPAEIVDAEGGVTRLSAAGGLVRQVVDPDGVEIRFEFDASGSITAAIDADGNVARIERDRAGRPTATVTPLGRRTTFRYNPQGLVTERQDPTGATWRYRYSPGGRLIDVTDPMGAKQEIAYGDHGAVTTGIDPLGNATSTRYDVFGNVVSMVAPDGAKWDLAYDALSRLSSIADPAGAMWLREYDVNGNITASVDPVGTRRTATVDRAGRVTALDDGLTSSTFEVDELGRALTHRRPDGTGARTGYDRCGRRIWVEDPDGGITRTEYSPGGKVRRVTSPSGLSEEFEYDRCGRVAARVDGAGRRWENRYDADGALVSRVGPGGESEIFRYDTGGRLTQSSAPGQGITGYTYDSAGQVTSVTDRVNGRRRFRYDRAGQLIEAVDANGGVTRYAYNERGWLTQVTDPLGGVVSRRYDEVGRLVRETDQLGRATSFSYDPAGRLIERTDATGVRLRWTYDTSGRVSSYGVAGSAPIRISRDALGRAVTISEPESFRHELRWNRAGRLAERRRSDRTGDLSMQWSYDADGRRVAMHYPDGTRTAYTYNSGGLLGGLEHPALGRVDLSRDQAGRLVGVDGRGLHRSWAYSNGDLVGYAEETGGHRSETRFSLDTFGRVVGATTDGDTQGYAYDEAGQLLSVTSAGEQRRFRYDSNGRLVGESAPSGSTTYEYDAAGELLARSYDGGITRYEYDANGRRTAEISPASTRTYDWDSLGRLTAIGHLDDGASSGRTTRVSVDVLGELASVDGASVMWDTADPFGAACWMDGKALLGLGSPWAVTSGDEANWITGDWQGTADVGRDSWGAPASSGGLALGFRGEVEFDGLTWLRNRIYEPWTRAFLSPDPLPPIPGTAVAGNPYHYAANNPVSLSDPLGLSPVTDAQLQAYRDQMSQGLFSDVGDWFADNWQYVAAGAMAAAGIGLMFTGVGGPAGVALLATSGGLISAGASTAFQKATTGHVNWNQVLIDGAVGVVAGAAGGAAGMGASKVFQASTPVLRGALSGVAGSSTAGMVSRGLVGQDPFDPRGMTIDLLLGGATGGVSGRLGAGRSTAVEAGYPVVEPPAMAATANKIYSTRVLMRMAEEPGPYHNFPESFDQEILANGIRTETPGFFNKPKPILSNDSVQYRLPGVINGKTGTFEIFSRPSESGRTELIMHRFFKPGRS